MTDTSVKFRKLAKFGICFAQILQFLPVTNWSDEKPGMLGEKSVAHLRAVKRPNSGCHGFTVFGEAIVFVIR